MVSALRQALRPALTASEHWATSRGADALEGCGRMGMMGPYGPGPGQVLKLAFQGGETRYMGTLRCRHKLCGPCQRIRGGKLAAEMGEALEFLHQAWRFGPGRIRFATFTVPNVENIAEGFDWLAESWHKILAGKTWGKMVAGGFRCFEVKPGKDGKWNVHLHAIMALWNPEVSYAKMHELWDKATGVRKANLRFDQLRRVKGRNGKSKAQAVAAYIAKYLVKFEDVAGVEKAPGGLAHLADALQGRRMWGAWGVAAVARKWIRQAKPVWMKRAHEWINGYRGEQGQPLESVELVDTSTGESLPMEGARPWAALFDGEPPDQIELPPDALAFTWWSPGPQPIFRHEGRWIGWRTWWNATQDQRRPTRYARHFAPIYRPKVDTEPSNYGHLDYSPSPFRASIHVRSIVRRSFHSVLERLGWAEAVAWVDRLPDHLRTIIHEREAYHGGTSDSPFTFA